MTKSRHLFPPLFTKPLSLIPGRLHATLISTVLNKLLAEQICEGELEFMLGRYLRVEVIDADIHFLLSFDGKRLFAANTTHAPDLIFRGNVYDFLLLAARKEDSDTLFFQRRLKIEGDTDMGLAIKNFLDSIEIESLPYHHLTDRFFSHGLSLYERVT